MTHTMVARRRMGVSALAVGLALSLAALAATTPAQAAGSNPGTHYCYAVSGYSATAKMASLDTRYQTVTTNQCYSVRVRASFYYGGGVYAFKYGSFTSEVSTVSAPTANSIAYGQGTGQPMSTDSYAGYLTSTKFTYADNWIYFAKSVPV